MHHSLVKSREKSFFLPAPTVQRMRPENSMSKRITDKGMDIDNEKECGEENIKKDKYK